MVRKCSAPGCTSGYKTNNNQISIYKFPDDEKSRNAWVKAMPNSVSKVTKFMGLCALHFPDCKKYKRAGRYMIPAEPPTFFPEAKPKVRKKKKKEKAIKDPISDLEFDQLKYWENGGDMLHNQGRLLRPIYEA